jgi:hypothetical protein
MLHSVDNPPRHTFVRRAVDAPTLWTLNLTNPISTAPAHARARARSGIGVGESEHCRAHGCANLRAGAREHAANKGLAGAGGGGVGGALGAGHELAGTRGGAVIRILAGRLPIPGGAGGLRNVCRALGGDVVTRDTML